jgi:hypothetical protein
LRLGRLGRPYFGVAGSEALSSSGYSRTSMDDSLGVVVDDPPPESREKRRGDSESGRSARDSCASERR